MAARGLLLVGLIAVSTPAFADPQAAPAASEKPSILTVAATTFAKLAKPPPLLIDVREPAEWASTGLPSAALGISISRPDFVEAVRKAVENDPDRPVAVICKSGVRSARAARALAEAGFTHIINVGDGMSGNDKVGPGWLASGLPTKAYHPN